MEFTVFKSIASPLFPFTAPFNLPSRGVAICNRRLEGNHDEHGAVCVGTVGLIALGRPEARGSFCSGKWTAECGTNCGGGWRRARAGSRGAMKVGLC